MYSEWTHQNFNLYTIIDSTLGRVCDTHGEIVKFMTCSTDGKFCTSLPSRTFPSLTGRYQRSHGTTLRLMERERAFTTCLRTRFDWKKYCSTFRPRLAKSHIVCIIKGFRPVPRQFRPGTAADAAARCMTLEMCVRLQTCDNEVLSQ